MAKSLLFIPDITGFTEFVSATEIQHGQHIISELLEIIIKSNSLDMEVSEVEGDAVLFYRFESIPSFDELVHQARTIFLNFQNHLKLYESQRICECGACTSASTLSLKFISHIGEIGFTTVFDKRKPFGADLIQAHWLLKNNVDLREYILLSKELIGYYEGEIREESWIKVIPGSMNYEKAGTLEYSFIPLAKLHKEVEIPPPPLPPRRSNNPYRIEMIIEKPMYFVFELIVNLELRLKWYKGVSELSYSEGMVNRVGTRHRCLFDSGFADFETIKNDFGEDKLVYGERLLNIPVAKEVSIYYVLTPQQNDTLLRFELHIIPWPIVGWVLKYFMAQKLMKGFKNIMQSLKEISESEKEINYNI